MSRESTVVYVYRAYALAKYIVNECIRADKPISNLQLQKILYFIQYNFLRNFEKPAFIDRIEAWKYGPVVPNVYEEFTYMGGNKILTEFDIDEEYLFRLDNNNEKQMIDEIVSICRDVPPWELVRLTHKKGTPWDRVYVEGEYNEITIEEICKYIQETR